MADKNADAKRKQNEDFANQPSFLEEPPEYKSPEDYSADEKITPAAIQTNAKSPPVVGEPEDPDDPAVDPSAASETKKSTSKS